MRFLHLQKPIAKGFFCFWASLNSGAFLFLKGDNVEILTTSEMLTVSMFHNFLLVIISFVLFRVLLRVFNKINGYTVPNFVKECRESKDYFPIAVVFAAQSLSAALLIGLIIS